jgi:hypothetical protein
MHHSQYFILTLTHSGNLLLWSLEARGGPAKFSNRGHTCAVFSIIPLARDAATFLTIGSDRDVRIVLCACDSLLLANEVWRS